MKNLFSLNDTLLQYRHLLFGGIFFVIISNFFTLYPAQIFRLTIDVLESWVYILSISDGYIDNAIIPSMMGLMALVAGALVLLASILRGLFLFFTRQTIINMSRHVEYEQKNELYSHYQNLTRKFYRTWSTGEMMSRISEDVSKVRMYTGPGIMYTINTVTLFIMVISTMLMVNVELTLYAILPLPLLCYAIYKVESMVTHRSKEIQAKLADLTAFTQETYSGIRSVKSYVREDALTEVFHAESETLRARAMALVRVNALFFPSIILLIGLSTLFTIWIGGEQVISGRISAGTIAEFVIYVNLLTWPVASLGWVSTMIQQAGASQGRILEFLGAEPEMDFPTQGPTMGPRMSIVFKDVHFTYPETGIHALRKVSFEIEAGKTLAIIGKTGSGKSSVASMLLRLQDADSGEVLLNGHPIQSYTRIELRQSIGFVPQDVLLFSDTIAANIAFGLAGADQNVIESAGRFAAIHDNILDFPKGYDTLVGEKGVTLSGGQKQRISLARAAIKNPSLFILDDALSAVDTRTEDEILSSLLRLQNQAMPPTVILISHRISTVMHADEILVMENGEIAERGRHADLLLQGGLYADIHRIQELESEFI